MEAKHIPNPRIAERKKIGPHLIKDEHIGLNGRLAVIMVGQKVAAAASDKQALQTYEDAEVLLKIQDEVRRPKRFILLSSRTKAGMPIFEMAVDTKIMQWLDL
jgi:hypothetical protein